MKLLNNVVKALDELGSSPAQIRQSLQRLGLKGKRNSSCDCVLAKYLQIRLNTEAIDITVSRVMWWEDELLSFCEFNLFRFTTFVSEFDSNAYPELVSE